MKFLHLQIPLKDVLEATNNFDDKNVIGGGDLGEVYQGLLLWSGKLVKIAARRFYSKHKHGIEFWREISALSSHDHKNIVSLIGFCDEQKEKVIIYKREAKGSLMMYLSSPKLTWIQRLRISIGIARALCYIHNKDQNNYSLIHRNINSSTILLDNKFEPKLSGFEYSINHSLHGMDDVVFSHAIGTKGYMDPEIVKTGGVTHKSDIYSFGVVLLEILCGRKAFLPNEDDDRFLVSLAKLNYEKEKDVRVPSSLYDQMCHQSHQTFTSAAILCVNDDRLQRRDMKYIVQELEKALELQLPYESLTTANLEHVTSQLSHLKISLRDITLATDEFSEEYLIGMNTFYYLYRAEFGHWDKKNSVSVEENDKSESPKRSTTVIIKRLLPREDNIGEDVFRTEVEMLATCKHHSIVTLLGFCNEDLEKILIIEDASNGYLCQYLMNNLERSILTWEKRLKICLDIANGLKYQHHEMEDQKTVISRYVSTFSISLDENFGAKIFDFGQSVFIPPNLDAHCLGEIKGFSPYMDPEYVMSGKLRRESDVYAFGLVLFEMLFGKLADDQIYKPDSKDGLAYVTRRCMEMIDPVIKEKSDDNNSSTTKGPIKDSIYTFVKIAYWCLGETHDKRPTMEDVVKELKKALSFQKQVQCQDSEQDVDGYDNSVSVSEYSNYAAESLKWDNLKDDILKHLKIPLSDILVATDNFSNEYLHRFQGHHKLYQAKLEHGQEDFSSVEENNKSELPKRHINVLMKRLITREEYRKRDQELFCNEIQILTTCNHHNIVPLLGFCDEDSEMILIFDITIKIYLDMYLNSIHRPILTWAERLRICLDIAYGLEYLHYEMEDQKKIIHRHMDSCFIALDENFRAQIASFDYSVFLPPYLDDLTLYQDKVFGILGYGDPEYLNTGKLKRESDVYSFGVILCEILWGKTAESHFEVSQKQLAYEIRRCIDEGTLKNMVDPQIKEERSDGFTLNRGPNKNSLVAFLEIAVACLVETQDKRPTIKVVIEELNKALLFQVNYKDTIMISLEDIQVATQNFHDKNCVGGGGFGKVYKGKLPQSDNTVVAKRLDTNGSQALNFLHGGNKTLATVIHRDIKPDNILLTGDWKAKLGDFGLSLTSSITNETDFVIDHACGTEGYVDPLYMKSRFLTKESDIYSFGVVLFEILCGRSTFDCKKQDGVHLSVFIKDRFEKGKGKLDAIVFEKIKQKIMPEALSVFQMIAYQCLNENSEKRPEAKEVVKQLKKALEFQMSKEVTELLDTAGRVVLKYRTTGC
ncbi:uncharacterized protein [Rutidosis leptorrhynchoides]|uniref:uncharacterized protein isoform X2 n=1 Tax=Rutidosis leptorrhynchoides TaxID=125765 RepID=UPI003A9A09CA